MSEDKSAPLRPSAVDQIDPRDLSPNPHNPRLFFPEESMSLLRNSISQLGILVPLTVYRSSADKKLRLLDGERRWRCALDLRLPTVPVNIVPEPTSIQNIVTMFNIHALREQWELPAMALKLEFLERELMRATGKKRIGVSYLANITNLPKPTVQRCKILLSFDKKYQDTLLARGEERISPDFYIELHPVLSKIEDALPDLYLQYGREKLIDIFLAKYRHKIISDVVDLRKVKSLISSISKGFSKSLVHDAIARLLAREDMTIDDLYSSDVKAVYELESIKSLSEKLIESIHQFHSDDKNEWEAFEKILSEVVKQIRSRLTKD